MINIPFQLSNKQRSFLGLIPVEPTWELVELFGSYYYFDGDIIRKKITVNDKQYREVELCVETTEGRTMVLPKTKRGKPKKFNFTATQSFNPIGVYFSFSQTFVMIGNYTTQLTFYGESFDTSIPVLDHLKIWLKRWIADTSVRDLEELEEFKTAKRKHCKFAEGDFFAYKIGRREWGFGRIMMDIYKYRKTKEYALKNNYGLKNLMGRPLYVKVYYKIADTKEVDLVALSKCEAMHTTSVMDNHYYYGEKPIIGHLPLRPEELEFPISYGPSIDSQNKDVCYFQYGKIYREVKRSVIEEAAKKYPVLKQDFTLHAIGFDFIPPSIKSCKAGHFIPNRETSSIVENSFKDLRSPQYGEARRQIMAYFGLDSSKNYVENLELANEMETE